MKKLSLILEEKEAALNSIASVRLELLDAVKEEDLERQQDCTTRLTNLHEALYAILRELEHYRKAQASAAVCPAVTGYVKVIK